MFPSLLLYVNTSTSAIRVLQRNKKPPPTEAESGLHKQIRPSLMIEHLFSLLSYIRDILHLQLL